MLLPVAVAPREIDPLAATELEDLLDDTTAAELDDLLDETAGTELEDLLDDTAGTEDRLEETGAVELVAPPHTAAVNCALFLPTPATCANLSFTHWGVTGE